MRSKNTPAITDYRNMCREIQQNENLQDYNFNNEKLFHQDCVVSAELMDSSLETGKKPNNYHQIRIQMLLNSDWCTEIHDITFFPMSPVHLKTVRSAPTKTQEYLICKNPNCCNFDKLLCVHVGPPSIMVRN